MKRHPNYSGKKVIASNGYCIVYVGRSHHLSDCRGYAYAHRVEAEKKEGRRLVYGEVVHHIDGNRLNNKHSNLIVFKSNGRHLSSHRSPTSKLRKPDEHNPTVKCACGCKKRFLKFDSNGRQRRFSVGCSSNKGKGKRNSDEMETCECGCGSTFKKYDSSARQRRFVSGHNGRKP